MMLCVLSREQWARGYQLCQKLCQLCQPPLPQLCQPPLPQPPLPVAPAAIVPAAVTPAAVAPAEPAADVQPAASMRWAPEGLLKIGRRWTEETAVRISLRRSATDVVLDAVLVVGSALACVAARAAEMPTTPAGMSSARAFEVRFFALMVSLLED